MTSPNPVPPLSAKAFFRRLLAGIALLNVFVAVVAAFWLHHARQQDIATAGIAARNLAKVLEQYVAGTVANIDLTLLAVVDEYARLPNGIDMQKLDESLARHLSRQPVLDSLRMTDAHGVVRRGLGVAAGSAVGVADRAYFAAARDGDGLAISKPLFARIGRKWVLTFARRVNRPDGSFAGVVYANLALARLLETFAGLDVGPRGTVTLRDAELGVVACHPDPDGIAATAGSNAVADEFRAMVAAGLREGTFAAFAAGDRVERVSSFRRIRGYPFYVVVGLAHDDFLAAWRERAVYVAALAALFLLVTLALTHLLVAAWRRQLAAAGALMQEETKFHTLADYTYDWEYWQSADRREILYMTPSCERITGYGAAEFAADPDLLVRIVHPDDRAAMEAHLDNYASRDEGAIDVRILRRDGEVRWIAHACRPVFEPDGTFMGRRVGNRDITERKRIEEVEFRLRESLRGLNEITAFPRQPFAEQLRRALRVGAEHFGLEIGIVSRVDGDRYEIVAHTSPPGLLADGQVFHAGQAYCSITLAEKRVVAISHMGVSDYLGHPCYKKFDLETYIGAPVVVDGEVFGTVDFSSAQPYAREFDDGDKEFIALLARWVGSAIERHRAEEQVQQLAYYDTLTGLPNRRMLFDRINQALAQAKRFGRSLAIMFLDLDNFKQINDTLGHEAGDQLLKAVAARLATCVRGADTVSRQGGDEFVVVLAEIAEPQDAALVAEKIVAALRDPVQVGTQTLRVTTSIGIAVYPVNGSDDVRELLQKADRAMYAAKAAGRDGYRFFADRAAAP